MKRLIRVLFVVSLLPMTRLYAEPLVTSVTLGTSVSTTHVVAVATPNLRPDEYVPTSTESSIFVLPGQTQGDVTTASPPDYFPGPTYSSSTVPMLGEASGYGTLLMQFEVNASDLGSIGYNFPANSNESVLSAASGPINASNLSLAAAGIVAGTSVVMTVDMQSMQPHLVAVMSGSYPLISYDSTGSGLLTISGSTTGSFTNNAGQYFSSSFGFFVVTDNTVSIAPGVLGMVAQSDHWIGDMFPLLPGLDSNAAIGGGGGTLAAPTARSGLTMNGPCGETRSASLFIATDSLPALYGATTTPADLTGFINDTEQLAAVNSDITNLDEVGGSKIAFDYSFDTSSVDISVGVSGSTVGAEPVACPSPGLGIKTDSGGGGLAYSETGFCIVAGLMFLFRRRIH